MPNINPGAGFILVEDLNPETEKEITSGNSNLELSGTNPHDQLKLGKVLHIGDLELSTKIKVGTMIGDPNAISHWVKSTIQSVLPHVGDIIAYQSLSAHALRVEGKQYRLVEFEHVIATIEENK